MVRRHTLNIDEELLAQAAAAHPHATTTALVNAGLRALVERDAAERLATMEGVAPDYQPPPRTAWARGQASGGR